MVEIAGRLEMKLRASDSEGAFRGTLSTYGNIDEVGDICEAGCFDDSVARGGAKRTLLWQHDQAQPIGSFEVVKTEGSLDIEGSFNLDTQRGREAYSLLKRGDIDGLSIGYRATDYKYDASGIRHLLQVDLLEGSLVTFPANTLARAQAKSKRLTQMSRYAKCAFLTKMSDEERNAALAELDELDREAGKDEEEAPDKEVPEDDEGSDEPDPDAEKSGDGEEDETDVREELAKLRDCASKILKKLEA